MPEKPLTIAAYAAGVSLAAATLIYVFAPTYFLDGDPSSASNGAHRRGVVGLYNPANDCFINSVLQSLAGLGELRVYLIREIHRRSLDGADVYKVDPAEVVEKDATKLDPAEAAERHAVKVAMLEDLRNGVVTHALKEVLDGLNERPLYRKTVSAAPFVAALQRAFRQRINRQQQDAQEFLQLVAERLSEEYHAGRKARRKARMPEARAGDDRRDGDGDGDDNDDAARALLDKSPETVASTMAQESASVEPDDHEEGFPFEGALESHIECLSCRFQPKPSVSSFVTLTLHVPQRSSTTLNSCFDGLLKTEYIEDFKCERCRLEHAVELRSQQLSRSPSAKERSMLESDVAKLREAIRVDPEKPPERVTLPDIKYAPRRRIARHVRIATFPKIIAIHLSRSIFDPRSVSMKNSAKVAFPEQLVLGGILDRRKYKLLGVVTHKGSHNSGHYESFRRQIVSPPYSTPTNMQPASAYRGASASPNLSSQPSPNLGVARQEQEPSPNLSPDPSPGRTSSLSPKLPSALIDDVPSPSGSSRPQSFVSTTTANPDPRSSFHASTPSPSTSMPRVSLSPSADKASMESSPTTTPRSSRDYQARPSPDVPMPVPSEAAASASAPRPAKGRGTGAFGIPRLGSIGSIGSKSSLKPRKKSKTSQPSNEHGEGQRASSSSMSRSSKGGENHRWWRISDDRVKESKTAEVLSMQREVYLLFYEMIKEDEEGD